MNTHVTIFLIGLVIRRIHADYYEDTWQEPNAWERHSASASTSNTCPVCNEGEDGALTLFYYKKLIANLFSKNTLQENEYNNQLEKTILFRLSPAQLAKIETSEDIRDLDAVISDILSRAKTVQSAFPSKESVGFLWLIVDIFKDFLQLLKITLTSAEARFGVLAVAIVLLIWFAHKRYKTSLLAIVFIGFVLFGYICTYLECNRKLEAEKMVEFIKENEHGDGNFLQKAFNSIFRETIRDKQISKIQKESKINLPFCRPDHVFLMYVNEMFLNQFQLVTEKCVEMLVTFKDKFPFPLNIVAIAALVFIFWLILPLIFKYMFNPSIWLNAYYGIKSDSRHRSPTMERHLPGELQNDRISGENLKIILEVLKNNGLKPEKEMSCSGVQEIQGPSESSTSEDVSDKSLKDESIDNEHVKDKKIEEKS